jgi:hypothetical protein
MDFTVNSEELEDKSNIARSPQCGFWLPYRVKIKDFCESWRDRYLSVKNAHENLTGNSWLEGDLVVEAVASSSS